MKKINQYMMVTAAAKHVGVSANTLRNWEDAGKIKPKRSPLSGYRLYDKDDLDEILREVSEGNWDPYDGE